MKLTGPCNSEALESIYRDALQTASDIQREKYEAFVMMEAFSIASGRSGACPTREHIRILTDLLRDFFAKSDKKNHDVACEF